MILRPDQTAVLKAWDKMKRYEFKEFTQLPLFDHLLDYEKTMKEKNDKTYQIATFR